MDNTSKKRINFILFKIIGIQHLKPIFYVVLGFAGFMGFFMAPQWIGDIARYKNVEQRAGYAQIAQEKHHQMYKIYSADLGELIKLERGLAEDSDVTFIFYHASQSGYSFSVEHGHREWPKKLYWKSND